MNRLAGYVFDSYDDVDGRILRSLAPSFHDLPEIVKTAARLSEDQLEKVSDDRFALIMVDQGRKMKKYATVDKGNTALSVVYLLKQAHLLPPTAVKIAAGTLIDACQRHGLAVPAQLKLAAETGVSPVSGKSQKAYAKNAKVSQIQFPRPETPKETTINPQLGKYDAGTADVDQRTNLQGVQGSNFVDIPAFPQKEKQKTAGVDVGMRQQSWRQIPYVDMSGWDPAQAAAFESAPAQMTLLEGRYAVDGYDQVKTASAYFVENYRDFHPRQRHEYCVKLASRMSELGIEQSEDVQRYGSSTYATDVDSYVDSRRSYVHEEFHPALDLLLEKRSQVTPETFAEALCDFDKIANINWNWGAQVADPWYSTFGPSLTKLAEENWHYDEEGTRISLGDLKELALNGHSALCKQFGKQFADEFAKNPKTVFTSLPTPNKRVLARMASQAHEGI